MQRQLWKNMSEFWSVRDNSERSGELWGSFDKVKLLQRREMFVRIGIKKRVLLFGGKIVQHVVEIVEGTGI